MLSKEKIINQSIIIYSSSSGISINSNILTRSAGTLTKRQFFLTAMQKCTAFVLKALTTPKQCKSYLAMNMFRTRIQSSDQIRWDEMSQEKARSRRKLVSAVWVSSSCSAALLSTSEGLLMLTTSLWRPLAGMELQPCEVWDSQHTESWPESTVCQVGGTEGGTVNWTGCYSQNTSWPLARRNSLWCGLLRSHQQLHSVS